jgi:RpiR family carbohydrate utilization transcriptional regulator
VTEALGARWTVAEIAALAPGLIPSEASVARALLERPHDAAEWSVADLAEAAGTSRATAVRACQSLGFSGFRELRRLLRTEAAAPPRPLATDLRDGDPPGDVLEKVFAASVRQLEHAVSTLSRQAFAEAVERVADARRVLVVASGSVTGLGSYAALRLTLAGRPAEAPPDLTSQYVAAESLDRRDALLAIANTGSSTPAVDAARAAADAGASVVAITSFRRSPLTEVAAVKVVVGVGEHEWRNLRVVFVSALDALQTAVALRLGGPSRYPSAPPSLVYRQEG